MSNTNTNTITEAEKAAVSEIIATALLHTETHSDALEMLIWAWIALARANPTTLCASSVRLSLIAEQLAGSVEPKNTVFIRH